MEDSSRDMNTSPVCCILSSRPAEAEFFGLPGFLAFVLLWCSSLRRPTLLALTQACYTIGLFVFVAGVLTESTVVYHNYWAFIGVLPTFCLGE